MKMFDLDRDVPKCKISLADAKNVVVIPYSPPDKKTKRECMQFNCRERSSNVDLSYNVEFHNRGRRLEHELKIGKN